MPEQTLRHAAVGISEPGGGEPNHTKAKLKVIHSDISFRRH